MRAGDDDPEYPRDRAHRRRARLLSGANLGSRGAADITGENFPGNRGAHEGPDARAPAFLPRLHRSFTATSR